MLNGLWKEFREIDTSRRALRSFGTLVGSVLLGLGFIAAWKHDWSTTAVFLWLIGIGCVLVVTGLTVPTVLKPVYRMWMGLAVVLGFMMTRIILTIVFYFVITPTGLLLRLFGKDPLRRAWMPDATYWLEKTHDDASPQRLERYY